MCIGKKMSGNFEQSPGREGEIILGLNIATKL